MSGAALVGLLLTDTADAWRAAGFDVDDDGGVTIGPLHLETGHDATAIVLAGVGDGEVDGIRIREPAGAPTGASTTHPNGVHGVDHVVITTPSIERTVAAFADVGWTERRRRVVPGTDPRRVQVFFWAGEVIIELVGTEPAAADADAADPAVVWGLALVADDLDATHTRLGERASEPRDAVQPGRRILALRHRDLGLGLPVAVMTPHVKTAEGP